jgi:hypothetical protein
MFPRRQPGRQRAARHDARRGQLLAALLAANRHRVLGAIARNALEGYALAPPGLHQETPPLTLAGA